MSDVCRVPVGACRLRDVLGTCEPMLLLGGASGQNAGQNRIVVMGQHD